MALHRGSWTEVARKRAPVGPVEWEHQEADGYRIQCLPAFARFRGTALPWDDAEELKRTVYHVTKVSRSRRVVQLAQGQFSTPVEVHVKRYNFKSWLARLMRAARPSRAREEFDLGWQLIEKGIRTPRPVWLAESLGRFPRYSIVATETLPQSHSVIDRWARLHHDQERLTLLSALGLFLRHLHNQGFYHDDCKAAHVLLLPTSPARPDEFFVIDLLGGALRPKISEYKRAKNLYQLLRSFKQGGTDLGFTPEHRQALLEAYGGSTSDAQTWDTWVKRVGVLKGKPV